MALADFKLIDPGAEGIKLYMVSGSQVAGITVSSTGCGLENYAPSLAVLESITLGSTEIYVSSSMAYDDYYFYETYLTYLPTGSNDLTTGSCTFVVFNPFLQAESFTYNNYNALLGNSSILRQSDFIYEVDRKSSQAVPSNLNAILSGSAVLAEIQDSNYSSLSSINGRYVGTKTDISDFKIQPAIQATLFSAQTYLLTRADSEICSQSYSDRVIEDYLFAPNLTSQGTATAEVPNVRDVIVKAKEAPDTSFTTSSAVIVTYDDVDVAPQDIIRVNTLTTEELMKVTGITKAGSPVTSSIEVERDYYGDYISNSASNWTAGAGFTIIRKVLGDTIYSGNSSKAYKITDKKLWVEQTSEVMIIDERGVIIGKTLTCTV